MRPARNARLYGPALVALAYRQLTFVVRVMGIILLTVVLFVSLLFATDGGPFRPPMIAYSVA